MLHLIVFIWGFTGILGKLIEAPSTLLVWYRMLIATVGLALYMVAKGNKLKVNPRYLLKLSVVGIIIAIHWITFFESIKLSTVSVALVCLATASFFTAILEPLFFKRKFIWYELLFGIIVVSGVYLIFEFESQYLEGIILALISAFMAALFTVINGLFVRKMDGTTITLYEIGAGFIGISIFFLITGQINFHAMAISMVDLAYLLILGLVCTAFAFAISVQIMKTISPYTVSVTVNLEPIYAIILALIFFGDSERMSSGFYIGAMIILSTIFLNSYLKRRQKGK